MCVPAALRAVALWPAAPALLMPGPALAQIPPPEARPLIPDPAWLLLLALPLAAAIAYWVWRRR